MNRRAPSRGSLTSGEQPPLCPAEEGLSPGYQSLPPSQAAHTCSLKRGGWVAGGLDFQQVLWPVLYSLLWQGVPRGRQGAGGQSSPEWATCMSSHSSARLPPELAPTFFCLQTVRSIHRRHCYPPTWQRWTFCLLPGALIAASAVLLYAFVETEENYFYIHSIWHMLIAGSVGFLLPPQAKAEASEVAGPLPRRKGCGYQLCINEQEELGLVDPGNAGTGVSITSVCTS